MSEQRVLWPHSLRFVDSAKEGARWLFAVLVTRCLGPPQRLVTGQINRNFDNIIPSMSVLN